MTNQLQENIINSFGLVKSDIIKIQGKVISIEEFQKRLLEKVKAMEHKLERLNTIVSKLNKKPKTATKKIPRKTKVVTKKIPVRAKKAYIAAKTGKKFHISHCPFARNIKPKAQVRFKSKNSALNKGYKPCKCV
ncbi:hypothetical protein KY345_03770 [Candidatus Woesearchaeota archaeon]|nr:hypothetical protein [Candidatus Woesearchaeota archaeon]